MIFNNKPFTVREAIRVAVSFLSQSGIHESQTEVYALIMHLLGIDKSQLIFAMDRLFEPQELKSLEDVLILRAKGQPLQYIIGKQEFMSLDFVVNPYVLIPRPETELLVETAIELAKDFEHAPKIVDVCTGSGCIIISICYYFKKGKFAAGDISISALDVAKKNAQINGVDKSINFYNADLLDHEAFAQADIIVSNPPYIPTKDIAELQIEVRDFEPQLALDGGITGLEVYQKLVPQAYTCLKPSGWLLVEIGWDQGIDLQDIFTKHGFKNIDIIKDYAGKDRIVKGQKVVNT